MTSILKGNLKNYVNKKQSEVIMLLSYLYCIRQNAQEHKAHINTRWNSLFLIRWNGYWCFLVMNKTSSSTLLQCILVSPYLCRIYAMLHDCNLPKMQLCCLLEADFAFGVCIYCRLVRFWNRAHLIFVDTFFRGFCKNLIANAVSVLTQQFEKIYLLQLGS